MLKAADAEIVAAHGAPEESALRKNVLLALSADPPNLTADDDDSMPAIGVNMEQHGNRCIGIFDEGKNLYRALGGKQQTSWGAATLSILFGGGDWKRNVLKDQNKFHMLRTCLVFVTTIIEEWNEFVDRDESTGLQYRFMNMHSQPRLGRCEEVMDAHVYPSDQAAVDKPGLPGSVLSAFVEAITAIDLANSKTGADYENTVNPYLTVASRVSRRLSKSFQRADHNTRSGIFERPSQIWCGWEAEILAVATCSHLA